MRTIGKIAALATALSLALVLTACGGGTSSGTAASSGSASASSSSEAASSASASASAESTGTEGSSAAETADMYTNEYFGIRFNLPKGWSFVDADTLGSTNQVVAAANQGSSIDMAALNADQSQIVLVGIEAPSDATANVTAEQYLESLEEQLKTNLGGTYVYTTVSATITFDGVDRELPASIISFDLGGGKLYVCEAVDKQDSAFFSAIAMGASEEEVTSAFENFSAATA